MTCQATDRAGNTATGAAAYTVSPDDGPGTEPEPGPDPDPDPDPTGPNITASASSKGQVYVDGSWARHPVQIRFTCESGARVLSCTRPATVSKDTGPAGLDVTGTVTDAQGRTATVDFLVRLDRTAPTLRPVITPGTVKVGDPAMASANATDAGSGIAGQSCQAPVTDTKGKHTIWCEAVDLAGNTAKAKATYTVTDDKPKDKPGKDQDKGSKDKPKDTGKDKPKEPFGTTWGKLSAV